MAKTNKDQRQENSQWRQRERCGAVIDVSEYIHCINLALSLTSHRAVARIPAKI